MELLKHKRINDIVNDITLAVENGDVDALEAFVNLKKLEEIVKQAKKRIDDLAIDEAAKHGAKTFGFLDSEITIKNSAGRYDYSNIPEITSKELELKLLKDKHKAALKNELFDLGTGEKIEPPIYKGGREILSIKLNK